MAEETLYHTVKKFWPAAFRKGTRPGDGFIVEDWFVMDGERYAVDFSMGSNWYQFDSCQDAYYYGMWVNPVDLQQLEYAEGDITFLQCENVEQYLAEMERRQRFVEQIAGDRDPSRYGLDDRDGRHWEKLEKQRGHYATSD